MKTRAKLLSIVLAAVMVIGSAIPAFAAPAEGGYQIELDQAGSFSQEGISIYRNSFLEIKGENKLQEFLMEQIQAVYRAQGVKINGKHIGVIILTDIFKIRE